jgi:uncharacterized membrane protein
MSAVPSGPRRLEALLAAFLRYGSCLASAAIALGLLLALIDLHFGTLNLVILPSMRIATMGIVLFILLPTFRVLLMLFVFVREQDYGLAAAATLVLAIVLLGVVIGIRTTSTTNGNPLQTSRPNHRTVTG